MDPPTVEVTEVNNAGLLGDGISSFAKQVVETMNEHPELLKLSLFTLECMDFWGQRHKGPNSSGFPVTLASDATVVSQYTPDKFERNAYYNRITGDGDHPALVYRSDFLTTPFPKPVGRFANLAVKSLRGVFDIPLNGVWDTVGPEIRDLIKARKINWSSIDPARFFTHGPIGEEEKWSLGPVVIWVGVIPGSTSSDTAHEVSQEILTLLLKNGVEDVVVEWREAVPQRLAGPPLMRHVSSNVPPTMSVASSLLFSAFPLRAKGWRRRMPKALSPSGSTKTKTSDKVYGVSNCHVLRKNTTVEYEHRNGAPTDNVRVCGMRRFQRGLDEIKKVIGVHAIDADLWAREIVALEAEDSQDEENAKAIRANRQKLEDGNKAIADLEAFYNEVTKYWSDMNFHRNIGHIQYAAPITVDVEGGTLYTSDWAAFVAAEAKVKAKFEGNVVDLGSKYSLPDLTRMFDPPPGGGATAFKYPVGRKLRIEGCATKEDLANPAEFDSEGQRCLIVGKDGNTTDLTVGRYAGLVSFTRNEVGIESVALGIYNSGVKRAEPFSAKGDSGALVWYTTNSKARIVGQLHSGQNKGGSTSNHVTYCTPGWYLLEQIRKKFKHADFYRTTWSA